MMKQTNCLDSLLSCKYYIAYKDNLKGMKTHGTSKNVLTGVKIEPIYNNTTHTETILEEVQEVQEVQEIQEVEEDEKLNWSAGAGMIAPADKYPILNKFGVLIDNPQTIQCLLYELAQMQQRNGLLPFAESSKLHNQSILLP